MKLARRALAALLLTAGGAGPAGALVTVTDSDDFLPFLNLDRPTGQFDETGLSGFEFLISSRTGDFLANDQYLISGNVTDAATSLGNELGAVADLSGVPFAFSIRHNRVGGRNFSFHLTNLVTSAESVQCWGEGCPAGSNHVGILNGIPPISDYNGLQVQVRAQGVPGSSAAVTIAGLGGVTLAGADLFDEVVTPVSPGTIPGDTGRRGQWLLGDSLDLLQNEWELFGTVTLSRPDAALQDRTMVRLSVDLVRDLTLPYAVPEPAAGLLPCAALAGLAALGWRDSSGRARRCAESGSRPGGRERCSALSRRWLNRAELEYAAGALPHDNAARGAVVAADGLALVE